MNYKTKNWKEDTEELYFGLKTAFNVFNLEDTYLNLVNELWDIFEAADYPVIYIKSNNELVYCLQHGTISIERLQKENKPIIVLVSIDVSEKLSNENLPLLYSTIKAKISKEKRTVTRYIVENHTLEKTFEVKPDLVKAISREKNIDSVIKD